MQKKPRIGLLAHEEIKNNQRNVVLNLHDMLGQDYHFDVLVSSKAKLGDDFDGVSTFKVDIPRWNPFHIGYVSKVVRKYLRQCYPDAIVCVSHPFPLAFGMLLSGMFFRTPLIVRMTGDPFSERRLYPLGIRRLRKYVMHEIIQVGLLRRARSVFCVGDAIAAALRKRGIPEEKIEVLPQPFTIGKLPSLSAEERAQRRQAYGISPDCKAVLFCGKLTAGKGADRLPKILDELRGSGPKIQIVVAGDGPLRPQLEASGHEDLILLGNLQRAETLELFQVSDVLLHPTRRDALPTVVLEAIAFGIPVVSTPVGEIPYYVSTLETTEKGMARRLQSDNLPIEPRPKWFDWEYQKDRYKKAFDKAIFGTF